MGGSTRIVVALCAALLAACARAPEGVRESLLDGMRSGAEALKKGDLELAEELYTSTFEMADKVGNESVAVSAADYAADAALAQQAPERALPLYERLVARYPEAVHRNVGRYRIPNNLAVLLARAGRVDEGAEILGRTLATFDGRPSSPAYPFVLRVVLTRNLVRMHSRHEWDARSEAALRSAVGWLQAEVDLDRTGQFTSGAYDLFKVLGDFASRGPRPSEAEHLDVRAGQVALRAEAEQSPRVDLDNICEPRRIEGVTAEACYEVYEVYE